MPGPHGAGSARCAQPLQGGHLVHGQRSLHPRAGARRRHVECSRRTRSSTSATTSTRAASCSTPENGRGRAAHRDSSPAGRRRTARADVDPLPPNEIPNARCAALDGTTSSSTGCGGLRRDRQDGIDGRGRLQVNPGDAVQGLQWASTAATAPTTRITSLDGGHVEHPAGRSSRSSSDGGPVSTVRRGLFDPPSGTHYVGLARRGLAAPHARDRHDGQDGRPEVQDLLRHRGDLGLRRGRGAHQGPGRLDHAPRHQRAHTQRRMWASALPRGGRTCTRSSSTTKSVSSQTVDAVRTRLDRVVERDERQLRRLGAVAGGPVRVAGGRPSRSRSPTRPTGRPRASVSSSTTSPTPNGSTESFKSGDGGWTVSGSPPGSGPNPNDWIVTDASGFPVGATDGDTGHPPHGLRPRGRHRRGRPGRGDAGGEEMSHLLD